MKKIVALLMALPLLLLSGPANAWDASGDVNVIAVELTYMPDNILFIADRPVGTCAAGGFLGWAPQGATQSAKDQNAQAVLSALLTARANGTPVRVFITSSTCQVNHLYLL
jgi:hypothetical protein